MRIVQIGADRSPRGILYPESPAVQRQIAYGAYVDALDIIGFSLVGDERASFTASPRVHIFPTNSVSKLFYGLDTIRIARTVPHPDVISVQDPFETGLLGVIMSWLWHVPLHVQVHTDFRSPAYAEHSLLNRLRVLVAGFVLQRATRIRVVSERIKKSIEKELHVKVPITVLPIFTDFSRFKNALADDALRARFAQYKNKFLVVARLEPEKNVALAIRALAQVAPKDSCLIIVGEGSERTLLETMAKELHIVDRVFFEGERDPAAYYALADLVLVPSLYEGYGLVILEALSAGKPVLANDVGIAREAGAIVADSKHFVLMLAKWLDDGPRIGVLPEGYHYKDMADYARRYSEDIALTSTPFMEI